MCHSFSRVWQLCSIGLEADTSVACTHAWQLCASSGMRCELNLLALQKLSSITSKQPKASTSKTALHCYLPATVSASVAGGDVPCRRPHNGGATGRGRRTAEDTSAYAHAQLLRGACFLDLIVFILNMNLRSGIPYDARDESYVQVAHVILHLTSERGHC